MCSHVLDSQANAGGEGVTLSASNASSRIDLPKHVLLEEDAISRHQDLSIRRAFEGCSPGIGRLSLFLDQVGKAGRKNKLRASGAARGRFSSVANSK